MVAIVHHMAAMPVSQLAGIPVRENLAKGQFPFQSFFLELTLNLENLLLFGLERLWVGVGIDPEFLELEPFLIEFGPELGRLFIELLLLCLEFLLRLW
jgi:hypothetical protein